MMMPEAAVDENYGFIIINNEVRFTREIISLGTVSYPSFIQNPG
jgi:hypothetical protein